MNYLELMKAAKAAMQAILDKAKGENRAFTDEEKAEFDKQKTAFDNAKTSHEAELAAKAASNFLNTPEPNQPEPPRVAVVNNPPKWKNGLADFLAAVANHYMGRGTDERLIRDAATGANTATPSEGGFAVDNDLIAGIKEKSISVSNLAQRCEKMPIGANSNRATWNVADDSDSMASGSRHAGMTVAWLGEGGTLSATQPKLKQVEIKLNKLGALVYATEEQMEDGVALVGLINSALPREFAYSLDEAILVTGTGAGMPLSLTNSDAVVSVAAETGQAATSIVYENIVNMWSRMDGDCRANAVWLINQDCEPELMTMGLVIGTGGVPVYMPAGGLSASPYASLMGRPVIPAKQCKTLGTTGDIWLLDMSKYQLIEKGGIKTAESIHVKFTTDQRAFRFIWRIGGAPAPEWQKVLTPANGTATTSPFVKLATRA